MKQTPDNKITAERMRAAWRCLSAISDEGLDVDTRWYLENAIINLLRAHRLVVCRGKSGPQEIVEQLLNDLAIKLKEDK